ncbi:MAG TPA: GNAT family N-acetyltransferase [Streptosporangiaceae bacterium]|jgi:predicted acetyltransferase
MADPYPVRPVSPEEFDAFHAVDEEAFFGRPLAQTQRAALIRKIEFDRTLAALDGSTPVGITAIWSLRMCLPGTVAPVAGVTYVAVLPTHRRRGILTSLMRRQLSDIRERGEAVAALFASEAEIYGRYGYGPASWQAAFSFGRGEGRLGRHAPAAPDGGLRLRITEPEAARAELAKVYEAVLPGRPGMYERDESWWDRVLGTGEAHKDEGDLLRCVIAEDGSGPRGYALYTARMRWEEEGFLADGSLSVNELAADGPVAAAALWADLLSRDLVTTFTATQRPVDDPLQHMLADPRRTRRRVSDGLWIRLAHVPRALALRRYSCPADLVIEVTDDLLPGNAGRWRLATSGSAPGPDGVPGFAASCEPATGPADLALDVATLGAAYLGGTRLGELAGAGLVSEHRRGAVAALSAAMSWDPAPWCPLIF